MAPVNGGRKDSPLLLAIDTSIGTAVALLGSDGAVLAARQSLDPMQHGELIGPWLSELFDESGLQPDAVTGVVAGMGPGPFTGLRVGIAAAKAFAQAKGLPLYPLISHDALAYEKLLNAGAASAPLTIYTDARRRELFRSTFAGLDERGLPERTVGPELVEAAALPEGASITDRVSAVALARLAQQYLTVGKDFGPAEAVYLRAADVTLSAPKRVTG